MGSLQSCVESGDSRCGICNARKWHTLEPSDAVGLVPPEVVASESEFYQCGSCGQMFWAGEKYTTKMDTGDYIFKVIIIGDSGTGKSSFIYYFLNAQVRQKKSAIHHWS